MRLFTALGMFQSKMEHRLSEKQTDGWTGWNTISVNVLKKRLIDNANRGDWVDVANLAMFLWYRQHKPKKSA